MGGRRMTLGFASSTLLFLTVNFPGHTLTTLEPFWLANMVTYVECFISLVP